jgi:uncharacterized membrane-anchored protein
MEDVAARVASLRARVAAAARARTGAEYARQQAEQAVEAATAALRQEFGVEAAEQAQALLDDFDRKIAAEVQKIEQALG